MKLPDSTIEGIRQYLQTNSDGTVFYLGTGNYKKRYIYVIDMANKSINEHYSKHLRSDIVKIDTPSNGEILVMTLQSGQKFLFSCENRQTPCVCSTR